MRRYVRVGSFHGVMECQVEREFLAIHNSPAMNAGGGAHGVGGTTRGVPTPCHVCTARPHARGAGTVSGQRPAFFLLRRGDGVADLSLSDDRPLSRLHVAGADRRRSVSSDQLRAGTSLT